MADDATQLWREGLGLNLGQIEHPSPSLAAHQEQHNSCLKAIAITRANATRPQADKQGMIALLSEYLRNHMLVTDLSCKEYMKVNLGNA